MGDNLFELMKKTSIFMIAAQMLIHFRPNESYEKYLKLLVGIMLIAVLFLPIMQLFGNDMTKEWEREIGKYETQMQHTLEGITADTDFSENRYLPALEEEIKSKLNNENIKEADVTEKGEIRILLFAGCSEEEKEAVREQCAVLFGISGETVEVVTDGND